ncbi:MAG: DUF72 domain-containing protein [Microcystaceae cyanobacterium]
MTFYLGCAVWSYGGWLGSFYPPKTANKDLLSLYSQRLTTVEGNTTFYAVPSPETVQRWCKQTPPSFRFCLKFPKTITHQGLLTPKIPEAIAFIERVFPLEKRLGAIFAQLPPNYSPDYQEDLQGFLQALTPFPVNIALEVRHLDWFKPPYQDQLNDSLTQLNIGKVLLDTRPIYNCPDDPQVNSKRRKPAVPLQYQATANFSVIRFISHPKSEFNFSYLQEWVKQVDSWLAKEMTLFFFIHCPIEDYSPATARYFQQQLEKANINIPSLPWETIPPLPQQLSLF